jgi:hypothetical protein
MPTVAITVRNNSSKVIVTSIFERERQLSGAQTHLGGSLSAPHHANASVPTNMGQVGIGVGGGFSGSLNGSHQSFSADVERPGEVKVGPHREESFFLSRCAYYMASIKVDGEGWIWQNKQMPTEKSRIITIADGTDGLSLDIKAESPLQTGAEEAGARVKRLYHKDYLDIPDRSFGGGNLLNDAGVEVTLPTALRTSWMRHHVRIKNALAKKECGVVLLTSRDLICEHTLNRVESQLVLRSFVTSNESFWESIEITASDAPRYLKDAYGLHPEPLSDTQIKLTCNLKICSKKAGHATGLNFILELGENGLVSAKQPEHEMNTFRVPSCLLLLIDTGVRYCSVWPVFAHNGDQGTQLLCPQSSPIQFWTPNWGKYCTNLFYR